MFKRSEAAVKLTFAAATGDGKAKLQAPAPLVVGSLERGNYRGVGLSLEFVNAVARVFQVVYKQRVARKYGSRLVNVLEVDRQMESLVEECHPGRVAVNAVDADGGIAGGVAQEHNVLVGVGEQPSGEGVAGHGKRRGKKC